MLARRADLIDPIQLTLSQSHASCPSHWLRKLAHWPRCLGTANCWDVPLKCMRFGSSSGSQNSPSTKKLKKDLIFKARHHLLQQINLQTHTQNPTQQFNRWDTQTTQQNDLMHKIHTQPNIVNSPMTHTHTQWLNLWHTHTHNPTAAASSTKITYSHLIKLFLLSCTHSEGLLYIS